MTQTHLGARTLVHASHPSRLAWQPLAGALIVIASVLAPVLASAKEAAGAKAAGKSPTVEAQDSAERTLAHKMMGHVNLASVALETGLPEAASEHIQKAEKLAVQLEREAPTVVSQRHFKYGKLSYSVNDRVTDYYVPIVDDVFLVSDYEETFHAFENADRDATDAGIVEVTISADLREVKKALVEAKAKIAAKKFGEANTALRDIFKHSIREERIIDEPIWAVHDNLVLAQNLIREKHYDGARFALQHARTNLGKLEKGKSDEKTKAEFKKMSGEIENLEADLRTQDPTLSQRADAIFSSWRRSVTGWFSSQM